MKRWCRWQNYTVVVSLRAEMLDVGRVIARPFTGTCAADFKRTPNRHDYSLKPPRPTMLDAIHAAGLDTIGVGKIYDIFAGQGVSEKIRTTGNDNGMEVTLELAKRDFSGLAFINLVDFDMLYGHRNDVDGYAAAATRFDEYLVQLVKASWAGRPACLSRQTTAVTRPPPLRIIPGVCAPAGLRQPGARGHKPWHAPRLWLCCLHGMRLFGRAGQTGRRKPFERRFALKPVLPGAWCLCKAG